MKNTNNRYNKSKLNDIFMNENNELANIALKYNSIKLCDPETIHYIKHYNNLFKPIKDDVLNLLEIGVKKGDSLKIWKDYFINSNIYGFDINDEHFKVLENIPRISVHLVDQTDIVGMNKFLDHNQLLSKFDIIIDDGGHTQEQVQTSFRFLFEYGLKNKGIYIIEDLGCSYWYEFGGGINTPGTSIEFLKSLIDGLNFRFWKNGRITGSNKPPFKHKSSTYLDKNIESVQFFKGLCIIKKGNNVHDEA